MSISVSSFIEENCKINQLLIEPVWCKIHLGAEKTPQVNILSFFLFLVQFSCISQQLTLNIQRRLDIQIEIRDFIYSLLKNVWKLD